VPTPELNKALAAVQAVLKSIAKRETGKVEGVTKQGKPYSYEYSYADLADVSDAILPLLGKHGLAYTAEPGSDDSGRLVLDYALLHSSGEERAARFPLWLFLPDRATAQTAGGLFTYFRRYCLCAVTGVAPKGEDDDAQEASKAKPRATPRAKTAHADREHADLVRTITRERERPADRTQGPIPDADDLWQDPPGLLPEEQAGSVTKAQLGTLHKLFTGLDVTGRDERLQVTERITGRELTGPHDGRTSSNLAFTEAAAVKRRLGEFTDHSELIAFMAGEVVTA